MGQLGAAAALTLILAWASASNVTESAKIGALVGLLSGIGIDFTTFGTSTIQNLNVTLVGPVVRAALWAIAGAAIAAVAGKRAKTRVHGSTEPEPGSSGASFPNQVRAAPLPTHPRKRARRVPRQDFFSRGCLLLLPLKT